MFNKELFAKKLEKLQPYKVDTHKYTLRLDANESCFQMTQDMRNAFTSSIRRVDFNRYPDPDATELCKAFSEYYGINAENVAAGNGSDEIISIIMNDFLDKGSAVMTFTPDFSMYGFYAELAELIHITCPKNSDLQIDEQVADRTIKEKNVRLVIFSNPCNPTGRIEKKELIKSLAMKNPGTVFVVDEAYMDFAGELSVSESFLYDVADYSNIIVLKTLSKSFGSAALRIGFIVAHKYVTDMFKAVKSPYNLNGVSQSFGVEILKNKELLTHYTQSIIRYNRELYDSIVAMAIAERPIPEMYTNFVFLQTSRAFEIYTALKEKGILVRYFNLGDGALRITTGSSSENALVIKALKEILG